VIWEAFQPQTEPRRAYRRSGGDPYEQQQQQLQQLKDQLAQRQHGVAVHRPPPAQAQTGGLPTQNAL